MRIAILVGVLGCPFYAPSMQTKVFGEADCPPISVGYMVKHSKRHSIIWKDAARKSLDNPDKSCRMDATRYQVRDGANKQVKC